MRRTLILVPVLLGALVPALAAQQAAPPQASPRAMAPIDLTGTWVSIVNEDWRHRMVTAPVGDFPGVPLSPAGFAIASAWDPTTDGSCQAFGAAGLMRMPTRLRISWDDDTTLRIETDNGQQTRLLHFGAPGATTEAPSLQGYSVAEWEGAPAPLGPFGIQIPGGPPPPPDGSLVVKTSNLSGGWLQRNGVPYSARTTMTEYFDRFPVPDGSEWFVVTTQVDDPEYLLTRFVTSTHFRREPDDSNWEPRPCRPI